MVFTGSIQSIFIVKNSDIVWRIMIVWLMQMATETVFILILVTSTLAKNAIPESPQSVRMTTPMRGRTALPSHFVHSPFDAM
jgi:hypothetical protein